MISKMIYQKSPWYRKLSHASIAFSDIHWFPIANSNPKTKFWISEILINSIYI